LGVIEVGPGKGCPLPAEGHARRKADHVRIALQEDVGFGPLTTGLERYRFVHQALPEIDLDAVDTSATMLGRPVAAPLVLSCMTGGFDGGGEINRRLAEAAQAARLPVGVGSQRAALEDRALAASFRVRALAPDVPLLANLGASEILGPGALSRCRRAVAMIEADALVIHLNPLQEALQPEGSARFAGLAEAIREVAAGLEAPVIVKEVGWGLAENVARTLADAGVHGLDVAGAGGTSWSEVERHRIADPVMRDVAASFREWGIPTAEAVLAARRGFPDGLLIASGGLRSGVDAAKCLALGADAAAFAAPLLRAAVAGRAALDDELRRLQTELRLAMFCVGAASVAELRATPHLARVDLPALETRIVSPTPT
jgi:isopentenyl-diphosphate delta-isomerase